MTYVEICRNVARECKLSEAQVRLVVDCLVKQSMEALTDGDEVKIRGLGTFYSKNYFVPNVKLEFGPRTRSGNRRRIRFRPFDSTNTMLTEAWNSKVKHQ